MEPPGISAQTLYWQTLKPLGYIIVVIVRVYLHSNFCGGLRKTHVFWNTVRNGPSKSSKVVDFDTNRKHVCDFLLVINSNLGPILPRFRDIAGFWEERPHLYSAGPKLIIRVINLELVQPMCPRYSNVTNRQTDGRTTYDSNTALALRASRGKTVWNGSIVQRLAHKGWHASSFCTGCQWKISARSLFLSHTSPPCISVMP